MPFFPDVVELLTTHLGPVADPVHVGGRVPKQRPTDFVQIRRVGGAALNPVRDVARVDVMTWAETDPEALDLGQQIRAAIWALSGTNSLGVMVYDVNEFKGIGSDDDPETGTPRTWATYELTVRADNSIQPWSITVITGEPSTGGGSFTAQATGTITGNDVDATFTLDHGLNTTHPTSISLVNAAGEYLDSSYFLVNNLTINTLDVVFTGTPPSPSDVYDWKISR